MVTSREIAEARVRAALEHLQQAQVEVERARQQLAAVVGVLPEYDRLGKLYERVRAEWYRLAAKRGSPRLDLDSDARARLAQCDRTVV
jgi:hypothetical protein